MAWPVETQDGFFCYLVDRSALTGLAIVHWIGCIYVIKRSFHSASAQFCCIKIHVEMAEISQRSRFYIHWCSSLYKYIKWWIIKVKHPSLDIYRKIISLMEINNIILMFI